MNRLPRTIGPAPSERTFEDLCAHLRDERARVTGGLYAYLNGNPKAKKRSSSPPKRQRDLSLVDQMKELGLNPEDIEKLAKAVEETE